MQSSPNTSHIVQADVIRLLAIMAVVFIHLMHPVYSRPDFLGGSTWWLANLLNAWSRVSVPLFIMLSGYLLIPRTTTFAQTSQRIFKRLLVPLMIWFAIYQWWDTWWLDKHPPMIERFQAIASGGMYHMYFLVILVGLYALLPVIQYLKPRFNTEQWWLGIKMLLWLGILYYFCQHFVLPGYSMVNFFTMWLPYLGYFLLGNALAELKYERVYTWVWYGATVLITACLGYLNVWLLAQGVGVFWRSSGTSYFDEYLSINVIMMSASLFHILLHDPLFQAKWWSQPVVKTVVHQLSQAAFGVFLIHFIVMSFVDVYFQWGIEDLSTSLLYFLVRRSVIVVMASFAIVLLGLRIPIVKKLFGG